MSTNSFLAKIERSIGRELKGDLLEAMKTIGSKTSLSESLKIAIAYIENYFEDTSKSEKVIKLIKKLQEEKKNE